MVEENTVSFASLLGPEERPDWTTRFLRAWHGRSPGLVTIWSAPRRWSLHKPVEELIEAVERMGLGELMFPPDVEWHGGGTVPQTLYVSVGSLESKYYGKGKRGRAADVIHFPGGWADLDVREGGFTGIEEIRELTHELDRQGLGPGLVVGSGSGGAHLYWPVVDGLEPAQGSNFSRRMRLLIQKMTGYKVDQVEDRARVLRLPGALRFDDSRGSAVGLVSLLRCDEQRWLDIDRMLKETEALIFDDDERRARVGADEHPARMVAVDGFWPEALVMAELEGIGRLALASAGSRTQLLFAVSCSLGEWLEVGALDESEIIERLLEACRMNGALDRYGQPELWRQIRNGIAQGRRAVRGGVVDDDGTAGAARPTAG